MKVTLNMEHVESRLGNNGVVLAIANDEGKLLGNLRIGRAKVEWRKRGIRESTPGVILTLAQLIDMFESREATTLKTPRPPRTSAAARKPGTTADTTRQPSGPRVPDARNMKRSTARVGDRQTELFDA